MEIMTGAVSESDSVRLSPSRSEPLLTGLESESESVRVGGLAGLSNSAVRLGLSPPWQDGKVFYELEFSVVGKYPQVGWVTPSFARVDGYSNEGVGDDAE